VNFIFIDFYMITINLKNAFSSGFLESVKNKACEILKIKESRFGVMTVFKMSVTQLLILYRSHN